MKKFLAILCVVFCAAAAIPAALAAEPMSGINRDAALYKSLGEKPGLTRLSNDFVSRLLADTRMKPFFAKANVAELKQKLADQFCVVSDGPCSYNGADMRSAHSNFDITRGDFNALVEVLQQSMDAQGIAFGDQNKLLARLAPMHRDVITVP